MLDPQSKQEAKQAPMAKMEPGPSLALHLHRRAPPLDGIPLYTLYTLPPHHPMPGPVRSAPTDSRLVQPPRPPNAWILYRSDKLRQLPPTAPGSPRRAQAEVSKLISNMWKNETEAIRAEYEQRADAKKAEHLAMYPGYRFQPMKKEDRERLREEKKLEKERDRAQFKRGRARPSPYAAGPIASAMPPSMQYYRSDVIFDPSGPSPPISDASSPNDAQSSDSQQGQDDQANSQPTDASPSPLSIPATPARMVPHSSNVPPSFPAQMHPSQFVPLQGMAPQSYSSQIPFAGSSQWQQQPLQQRQQVVSAGGSHASTPAPIWTGYNSFTDTLDTSLSQDFVRFDLPPPTTLQGWEPGVSDSEVFNDQLQAMMSTTGDPSVFQLSNFNIQDLLSNPEGEIEVSLGQIPFSFGQQSSNGPDMFCHYNFGSPVAGPSLQSTENTNVNLSQTLSSNETLPDFSTFFSNQPPNGSASIPEQRDSNSFSNDNIFQFLDLEAAGPADAPASSQAFSTYTNTSLDQDSIQSTHTMPPGPYVPPTGAAYSSTRRVAASWKPPFVTSPDSPVEHSPKYT